jgi:hypothetical protein
MKYNFLKLKQFPIYIFAALLFLGSSSLTSCKVKEGCATKQYTNNMEKTKKRGKYNLFPKDMRKKMKK